MTEPRRRVFFHHFTLMKIFWTPWSLNLDRLCHGRRTGQCKIGKCPCRRLILLVLLVLLHCVACVALRCNWQCQVHSRRGLTRSDSVWGEMCQSGLKQTAGLGAMTSAPEVVGSGDHYRTLSFLSGPYFTGNAPSLNFERQNWGFGEFRI
ncbi:hypothetical protein BDV09DRAFT_5648 [Aspergillus tetrazonus]